MPLSLDQILPSLQSLGLWTYWIIALFALLEAVVLTGIVVPGTLVVIAGGMLAQRGTLDFFDLAWFVAAGAVIGGEISFRLGRLATGGLGHRRALAGSHHAGRAADLLRRHGAFAMVIGRFLGPLAAFVPFSAALAGMTQRRFSAWNAVSAVPYALILPAFGYASGRALGTLGAAAPRALAVAGAGVVVLAFLWFVMARIRRALPLLAEIAGALRQSLLRKPPVRAVLARFPRLSGFVAARFGTERFLGLTATILVVLFLYVVGVWTESVFDFLGDSDVTTSDNRLANMLFAMRDPHLVAVLGWITDAGGRHGVLPMLAGTGAALLILRRFDLFIGVAIAAIGNQLTVTLLKSFFDRPRSALGYFVETSGSFPSGHAAGSVAVWAMLFYVGWRMRLFSAGVAAIAAVTVAFLIGFSRVYLVEHYLSDVLNGYLVGALWLILGVAWCEWRRDRPRPPPAGPRAWAAAGCLAAALALTTYFAFTTANPLNPPVDPATRIIAQPAGLFEAQPLADSTESLVGVARQRVNLIVTAPDGKALATAMQNAGWLDAPRPGLGRLAAAVFDDVTGRALPDPLVIPTFWDDRPSTLGFAMPASGGSDDQRLHARFWDSRFRTARGETVFVGTVTREDPVEWAIDDDAAGLPNPDVSKVLSRLAADLRESGLKVTTRP
ncbi:bifunctional DedA family/phosphatase PAP2 family protein [Oceaniglobus indicus]|uniref:bifunctional DedA family/phosphatase PAP2 family protein n=1 Tax=Oceaniglobus indicus TaxID=2047749 RepID=UPI000C193282|nr:bifunctional DedA family/phosphatase PAP2 family protein [Oceaniglobus indicus]